jgi:lipopolysaccharide assembly outer membrane protein LptD (OstA)
VGVAGTSATARADPGTGRRDLAYRGFPADTDSVTRDTTARDTTARDTTARDTLPTDTTEQVIGRDTTPAGETDAPADTIPQEARDTIQEAEQTVFPEPDAIFNRLVELPGYRVMEYRGRAVELEVQEEAVRLSGEAEAKYATSVLQADTIHYMAGIQFITARRNVSLVGEGQNGTTDSILNYDVSGLKGTIMDARTSFSERGTEWYVRGDATLRGERTVFVEAGQFTSCDLDEPHYYFKAGQIKVVTENVIVAWPVTLFIDGVPIAWLPFFAQDIRPGRRSGFLPPRFGINDIVSTSGDVNRQVSDFGYYFAINDFMDSQVTIDWFSGEFTRLNGAFRYRDLKKHLRGNLLSSYSFGNRGKTLTLNASHQQELTPVTDIRLNANFVQNTRLFEERSFDPREQTQQISSDFGLNHRFPFAALSMSARRTQQLGAQRGRTQLTLPDLRLSFSPLTLFRAPRARAGMLNNMTLSGGVNFTRRSEGAARP